MTDPLRVLVVTVERAHEVTGPLEHADCDAATVQIDDVSGFLPRNVAAVGRTRRAIREHDPDVLLLDASELLGCLAALVAVLSGVPVVYRFKGDDRRTLLERHELPGDGPLALLRVALSLAVNRLTYALATGYVTVSSDLRDVVVDRLGCDPGRVAVVHVPVDPARADRFAPGPGDESPESGPEGTTGGATTDPDAVGPIVEDGGRHSEGPEIEADTLILTVTNLRYRGKLAGVETVVEGLRPLLAADEDLAYLVLGGGRYHEAFREYLDREIDDPSVRRRVYAPGFLDDIAALYRRADVMVYVSHIDGYPNAVLESQLAELPVVANDAHGMSEQIDHRETGYLLEAATPAAVTRWVGHVLDSPAERARVAAAARRQARSANDPARIGPQLGAALRAVLETGAQSTE